MDRDVKLHILKLRGWSIDQRLEFGIPPGKLQLPLLNINFHEWTHGTGYATLTMQLPNNKKYQIQRTVDQSVYTQWNGLFEKSVFEECSMEYNGELRYIYFRDMNYSYTNF